MMDAIKTSNDVQFDVLYADGTKHHAKEGVLFEADGDQMIFHLGTSRPEVLFAVAEALTETIDAMGLSDAFLRYLKFTDEQKREVQHEETADAGEPV